MLVSLRSGTVETQSPVILVDFPPMRVRGLLTSAVPSPLWTDWHEEASTWFSLSDSLEDLHLNVVTSSQYFGVFCPTLCAVSS